MSIKKREKLSASSLAASAAVININSIGACGIENNAKEKLTKDSDIQKRPMQTAANESVVMFSNYSTHQVHGLLSTTASRGDDFMGVMI